MLNGVSLGEHVLLVHGQLLQRVVQRPAVPLVEATHALATWQPRVCPLAQSFEVVLGRHLVPQEERIARFAAVGDALSRDQLLDHAQTSGPVGLGHPRRLQELAHVVKVELVRSDSHLVGRQASRGKNRFEFCFVGKN